LLEKDALKLPNRHRIGRLFWLILSAIGLSNFCAIVQTLSKTCKHQARLIHYQNHY